MQKQNGAESSRTMDRPYLGPTTSQTEPMRTRAPIVPVTAARPADPRLGFVSSRSSLMMAIMGAAAKVDTKETKKPIQDMWKDAWCGWLNEKMLRLFALFSLRKRRSGWGSGQRDDVGGHGNHEPGGRNFLNGDDEALRQVFNIAPVSAAETENGGVAARGSYLSTGIGNVGGTYSCWAEKADIFRACGARCLPWTLQEKG